MTHPLILASASPRRRQLLKALGLPFTVQAAEVDETVLPHETPRAHVQRLAREKARTIALQHPQAVVLAADTIVVQQERILGKPADAREAGRMLRALRQAPHQVLTAIALVCPASSTQYERLHESEVIMRPYSEEEIAAYIATGDPLDKAGAYGIQHTQFKPVATFTGCFASIMGLPLAEVADLLAHCGLTPASNWPVQCQAITKHCCRYHP